MSERLSRIPGLVVIMTSDVVEVGIGTSTGALVRTSISFLPGNNTSIKNGGVSVSPGKLSEKVIKLVPSEVDDAILDPGIDV